MPTQLNDVFILIIKRKANYGEGIDNQLLYTMQAAGHQLFSYGKDESQTNKKA